MTTITAGNWKGLLGQGFAPRELEATLYAAADLTVKKIARLMGIAPGTVSKRLDSARFKLGVRSIRGLVVEAFKRGLIQAVSPKADKKIAQRDEVVPRTIKGRIESIIKRPAFVTEETRRGLIQVTPDAEHRDDSRDAVFRA